jgi:two-component system response regulator AlgR
VHERSAGPQGEAFDGWVVVLDGVPERLQVSRRQLPSVREALRAEATVLASGA